MFNLSCLLRTGLPFKHCFHIFWISCSILFFSSPFTEAASQSDDEPLTLADILNAYCKAQGGMANIDKLQSVSMNGTVELEDETINFIQTKKHPNLVRLILKKDDLEIVWGYNGKETWQMLPGQTEWSPIPEGQSQGFMREAHLFGYLIIAKKNNYRGAELIGKTEWNNKPTYQIRYTFEKGDYMDYFLDQATFYELKTIYYNNLTDNVSTTENHFTGHFKVGDLVIPRTITSLENGVVKSTTTIEKVRLNLGVFNKYFDPPQSLRKHTSN